MYAVAVLWWVYACVSVCVENSINNVPSLSNAYHQLYIACMVVNGASMMKGSWDCLSSVFDEAVVNRSLAHDSPSEHRAKE